MGSRAQPTEVVKMLGGTYPPNWDATSVGHLCDHADYVVDAKTYPDVLLGTSTEVVQLCNEVVVRYMAYGDWVHAGGPAAGTTEPVIWTRDMLDRLDQLSTDATLGQAAYMKMQADP